MTTTRWSYIVTHSKNSWEPISHYWIILTILYLELWLMPLLESTTGWSRYNPSWESSFDTSFFPLHLSTQLWQISNSTPIPSSFSVLDYWCGQMIWQSQWITHVEPNVIPICFPDLVLGYLSYFTFVWICSAKLSIVLFYSQLVSVVVQRTFFW